MFVVRSVFACMWAKYTGRLHTLCLEHNPGFKNVQIDVKEARTDYVAAMGKFLPYVSVQAEVGRHIGRLSIRILMDIQPIHIIKEL